MKIEIKKKGCRFGGCELGIGSLVELNVKEIPPLWVGRAEEVAALKRQSKTKEKEQ